MFVNKPLEIEALTKCQSSAVIRAIIAKFNNFKTFNFFLKGCLGLSISSFP